VIDSTDSAGSGCGAAEWIYTSLGGNTLETTDNCGNRTWTGYWGPYGEEAEQSGELTDSAIAGVVLGQNAAQGKFTSGDLTIMDARVYQSSTGRFLQLDLVDGGCANLYTYGFGDPINHPDTSGQSVAAGTALCSTTPGHNIFEGHSGTLFAIGSILIGLAALGCGIATAGICDAIIVAADVAGAAIFAGSISACVHGSSTACVSAAGGLFGLGGGLAGRGFDAASSIDRALAFGLGSKSRAGC
jgi:RHS repeat-associated protein